MVDELLQRPARIDLELAGLVPADGAVGFALVLVGEGIDAGVSRIHHVVLLKAERGCGVAGDLEGLVAAAGGDYSVGRGDGGDDVLDHALGQRVGDTLDAILLGAVRRLLEQPCDVLRVVLV